MKKRPLCLAALIWCGGLLIAFFLNLPILPGVSGRAEREAVDAYLSQDLEQTLVGRVRSVRRSGTGSFRVLLRDAAAGETHPDGLTLDGVRFYLPDDPHLRCGDVVRVRGYPARIADATNPGQFRPCAAARLTGAFYEIRRAEILAVSAGRQSAADRIRDLCAGVQERLADRIRSIYPDDVSGIVGAVLIGDRGGMEDEQRALWQAGGISHILAISGLHLTLIGMGLFRLLRKTGLAVRWCGLCALTAMTAFTAVIGFPVSALRALVMFGYLIGAQVFFRSYDRWNAIALAAILILAQNPWYLFAAGFQMSFAAVILLALFRGRGVLFTALALWTGMLPFTLWHFYKIPLFGVLLNLLIVPLLPFLLAGGLIGTAFGGVSSFPAVWMVRGAQAVLAFLNRNARLTVTAGRPSLWQIAFYAAVMLALFLCYRKLRRTRKRLFLLAALPAALTVFFLPRQTGMTLTVLDVGQGDGIVCRVREHLLDTDWNIVVDGGSSGFPEVGEQRILPYLSSQGIRRISYLFITHTDQDHMNGILEILKKAEGGTVDLSVEHLVLPQIAEKNDAYRELEQAAARLAIPVIYAGSGDVIRRGDAVVRVLNPSADADPDGDMNGNSLVLLFSYGDFDALLTGDVSGAGEEHVRKELTGESGSGERYGSGDGGGTSARSPALAEERRIEVLKVAHHGSRYSTPEAFLEAVRPACGVISCGAYNSYGHPHAELLERLAAEGVRVFRTDRGGAVTIRSDGNGFTAESFCTNGGMM